MEGNPIILWENPNYGLPAFQKKPGAKWKARKKRLEVVLKTCYEIMGK